MLYHCCLRRVQVCQPHQAEVVDVYPVNAERTHFLDLPGHVIRRNHLRRNEAQSLADGDPTGHEPLQIVHGAS